ncbi:hypothetical protein M378DRAFT_175954 [Amanita muscaria Koide BX008]|uniref:Uncharacterized protein n=1 Tax=Amanita muscaria (strain Koide BX008) TaxID=946122 RepID=A0A0C2XK35_AMAMK|nr:hypothetical protein M378DRAFT_175954 [Amanita muscaria Koide BX008]
MNPPPPPLPPLESQTQSQPVGRSPSTAIHRNAEKLLALIESERNAAIAALTPQIIEIQKRLIQFQDRLANSPNIDPEAVRELVHLQERFTAFRDSSGILDANVARVSQLEATIAQSHADNNVLLASNSTALRDATVAREQEQQVKEALENLKKQLNSVGMGCKENGRLGFGQEWKDLLEEAGKLGAKSPGQSSIPSGIAALAARMQSEREAATTTTVSSSSNTAQTNEVIDLVDDSPPATTLDEAH